MFKLLWERIKMTLLASDNGGGRVGLDRRQFSYVVHVPERRSGTERRNEIDRRKGRGIRRKSDKERRTIYLRKNEEHTARTS